ncbi:hypothetical protein CGLO_01965 [Colletotrichum gloeosporioides Cg-14]|uniref:Uncharacterized protein n=1 Tax=Colletotrichum gloeosporioides (strain Cg-14) TaxID=1237896 RepID=T0L054_COLGC|nr:hypothetical protein CGLO_01965 [Colletotrichum gloeosporioides Cg-14]
MILEFHKQIWDHLHSRALQNFTGSLLISRYALMTTSERKTKYEELRNSLRAIWDKIRKNQQKVLNDLLSKLLEAYGPAVIEDAKAQIAAIDYETEMERTEEIVAAVRLKVMISAPSSIPCAHLDW